MPDTREVLTRVAREIEASSKTSATPPGQTEGEPLSREAHVEAINQVFALFRLNYHNQYYAAYPDAQQLNRYNRMRSVTISAGLAPDYSLGEALAYISERFASAQ